MMAGEFSFEDLLTSYRMLKRMGSFKSVLGMMPGIGKQLQGLDINEKDMGRVEAIVLSMTPRERRMPHLIDLSRRRRIAAGSGTTLDQVNQLMSARKQMQKMMKGVSKGKMPGLPAGMVPGGNGAALGLPQPGSSGPGRPGSRGKHKKKRSKR
jgi:signal recognition particle subunit SRP54